MTAKDKLRRQLQKGMDCSNGSVSFSSQHADRCTMEENGIEDALEFVGQPLPDMYSADLSLFVLDAGLRLLEERRPDILYLSLTDYIQHAYAPGHPEADRFYAEMDVRFGRFEALGATVALTADHGMNEKTNDDGTPCVVWLQDILDAEFGEGARTVIGAREVDHDLSGLKGHRLRTHGSVHEANVPIILSRPVSDEYARRAENARLHSYEAFDYAFNGVVG